MEPRSAPHSYMRGKDRAGVTVVIGTPDHVEPSSLRDKGALIRDGRQAVTTASRISPGWQSRAACKRLTGVQSKSKAGSLMPFATSAKAISGIRTDGLDLPDAATARRYALTPGDAQAMRDLQVQIAGWKQDGTAQGSFGLGVDGCATGAGPVPDATGSLLIRLEDKAAFLPLIDQGKLADLLSAAALAAIKPCNGAE